jgi:hypothetical protein
MTVPLQTSHQTANQGAAGTIRRAGFRVTEWVLGIVGTVAAFLGGFILLGGENQSIGLGGEASWRVSDIDPAWGYGLLIGGGLLLLTTLGLVARDRRRVTGPAAPRSSMADVLTHGLVFVAVNAFLWIQDIAIGGGLDYAYWITIPWGIGLVVHAITASREENG